MKKSNTFETGVTLLELMIVVVIIGILAAIAYPSYTGYIARGRRTECRAGVMQAMQQQERYFTQYNTYLAVAADMRNPPIKNFSGDRRNTSACVIASTACSGAVAGEGAPGLNQCVEVHATYANNYRDPSGISDYYLDSLGRRSCSKGGGGRYVPARTATKSQPNCWER